MYHILYTASNGDFVTTEREFLSFAAIEQWLRSIGATYWEIGLPARKKALDFGHVLTDEGRTVLNEKTVIEIPKEGNDG